MYGDVDKDIYIRQPEDYVIPDKMNHVLKLNKALYSLHQTGKCWYEESHHKLITNGFKEIKGIPCVYYYKGQAIVIVYVDDLFIFAKNKIVLNQVITLIENIYQVENLGSILQLLGIQFTFSKQGVTRSCPKYIEHCMKRFNLFKSY